MFQDAAGVSIVIFMDYRNNPLFYQEGRVAEVSVCINLFTKFSLCMERNSPATF